MANVSCAYGKIEFESTSPEYLTIFIHYFQKVKSKEYYGIRLNTVYGQDLEKDRRVIERCMKKNLTIYSFSDDFDGSGKYRLRNNFDFFFNLEKYKTEINELTGSKYEDMIKSMTIELDYVDEEVGCELLEEVTATLIPKIKTVNGERVCFTKVLDCNVTDYAYTAENLQRFDFYEEPCSLNYVLKHVDYYFDKNENEARKVLTDAIAKNQTESETVFHYLTDLIEYFDLPL